MERINGDPCHMFRIWLYISAYYGNKNEVRMLIPTHGQGKAVYADGGTVK